ncbi:hypothetical protein L3Q82_023393 [Scortum barcoo]|uniref:Uncharacterized protein n=1 Tax=Scortum barcoo TaxID=214431 RepID=A0ACB8WYU6_9TELE|nr:hypothetical protein L3Q82_023393 [Scortum barcoo]
MNCHVGCSRQLAVLFVSRFLLWWRTDMMAVWAAVLIVYGVFPGSAMQPAVAVANTELPLDLADDSVDDWRRIYYNKNWKGSKVLGKEQIVALYAYTSASGNIYKDFNAAVRSQRSQYKTTFRYHAFHFYLTVALQALKARERGLDEICFTVYRRDAHYFSQNVLNKEIRFGSFASSSKGQYINAETFGDASCFEIYTCSGADVSFFSKFGDAEGEVLIPPYEVFKVTAIQTRSEKRKLPCDVVYTLKSTHFFSNLDCSLFKK